jgi:virginiamycin B lyase
MIWYVDFSRGYLGRLDPTKGEVREWLSPSGPKSEPYGIVFTKGAVWYSESNAKPNTMVRFDPGTEKFQTWAIPGGGDIVRNMDVSPDGNPLMANSLTNQLGIVQIK